MENITYRFAQQIIGQERKVIAAVIATTLGGEARYAGAPTLAYEACGWHINKQGVVTSPELNPLDPFESDNLKKVLDALIVAEITATGDLTIILSSEGHTPGTYANVCNLVAGKDKLLGRALGRQGGALTGGQIGAEFDDVGLMVQGITSEGYWYQHQKCEIGFCLFNATLDSEKIRAYADLAVMINDKSKEIKYASDIEKETDNDKYSLRVWLLRLGFIGGLYTDSRKVLLSNLQGNSSFRRPIERD